MKGWRWGTTKAINEAKEKTNGKSKSKCREQGLYAEWMAVYRFNKHNNEIKANTANEENTKTPSLSDTDPLSKFKDLIEDPEAAKKFMKEALKLMHEKDMLDDFILEVDESLNFFDILIEGSDDETLEFFIRKELEKLHDGNIMDVYGADYRTIELLFKITENYTKLYGPIR